jgi:hypothetical protein
VLRIEPDRMAFTIAIADSPRPSFPGGVRSHASLRGHVRPDGGGSVLELDTNPRSSVRGRELVSRTLHVVVLLAFSVPFVTQWLAGQFGVEVPFVIIGAFLVISDARRTCHRRAARRELLALVDRVVAPFALTGEGAERNEARS